MTAHASRRWNYDIPVDEEVVNEVTECIRYNGGTPMVFGIFSHADAMVYNIARFLESCKTVVDEAAIRAFIFEPETGPTPEQRERIVELFIKVTQKLERFGKEREVSPEPVDLATQFTKISIPLVKKPFPKLNIVPEPGLAKDLAEGLVKHMRQAYKRNQDDGHN